MFRPVFFVSLLAATCLLMMTTPAFAEEVHQQQQQQHQPLHERMDDLVGSVKEAVKNADAAADKHQVVDLGQSLHLLEAKFSGLRAALAEELGASKEKLSSHSASAQQLMERSTELVRSVVAQRDDLKKLSSDMREIDSAIRAIREGLDTFDREMDLLNKVASEVHDTHEEISMSHDRLRSRVSRFASDGLRKASAQNPIARWLLIISVLEIIFVGIFLFLKRSASRPGMRKAYGKFG